MSKSIDLRAIIIESMTAVLKDHGLDAVVTYTEKVGYISTFNNEKDEFIFNLKGKRYFLPLIQAEVRRRHNSMFTVTPV